jgi:hypothetical protein
MPGVDNFHYDVYLSPVLTESVSRIIFHLIIKASGADDDIGIEFDGLKDREEFKLVPTVYDKSIVGAEVAQPAMVNDLRFNGI